MAGLVPATYVLLPAWPKQDVGARHKAGHDDREVVPQQTESLSLEFPGMSEAELEVVLAPVREVKILSLDTTAVGDAFVRHLARRWDLRRLNVRDTQVSPNGLLELRAAHPRLRTVPRPHST